MLMVLVPDSKFGDKILIQLGTQTIDIALQIINKKEIKFQELVTESTFQFSYLQVG